VALYVEVFHI